MTSTDELVEEAIARARWVFPVPGGPCRSIPLGGLRPVRYETHIFQWVKT